MQMQYLYTGNTFKLSELIYLISLLDHLVAQMATGSKTCFEWCLLIKLNVSWRNNTQISIVKIFL